MNPYERAERLTELSLTIHREARRLAFEEVRKWARKQRARVQGNRAAATLACDEYFCEGRLTQLNGLDAFLDERERGSS